MSTFRGSVNIDKQYYRNRKAAPFLHTPNPDNPTAQPEDAAGTAEAVGKLDCSEEIGETDCFDHKQKAKVAGTVDYE